MVKAFLMLYTSTICIMEKGQPCLVPVKKKINEGKMLSAFHFIKGIKKKGPIFLATLKLEEEAKEVQALKAV